MTTILFRPDRYNLNELSFCKSYFNTVTQRTDCKDDLVIGRYSCLPYYRELEKDLKNNNCQLINTYEQHRWIANFEWYNELKDFTPESWTDDDFYTCQHNDAFVVKGRTNSRKFSWNTKMFAKDKKEAIKIGAELSTDPLIGPQGIIYRKYIPLQTLEIGINGLPFTNEWRYFCYKDKTIVYGYYWSTLDDQYMNLPYLNTKAVDLIIECKKICKNFTNFYVLDIAETQTGEWILIEINDGQCAGLSCIDYNLFYRKLKETIND